jgi:hypothetical protein
VFDFDWKSSLVTLVILIPAFYLGPKFVRFLIQHVQQMDHLAIGVLKAIAGESFVANAVFRRYCRLQLDKEATKFLPVPGSRDVVLKTDDVYIPLRLENAQRTVAATVNDIWKSDIARVRIVGDPGSGKSSLVKQVFRQACRLALADPRRHLPIIINLKDFVPPADLYPNEVRAEWAIQYIRQQIGADTDAEMGKLFDSALRGRGLLLLLDGLDEVATDSFSDVSGTVNALSRLLEGLPGKNRIVLTMRTQFHQQVKRFFLETFPPTFYIQQFTPGEIYSFLRRWPFPAADLAETVNRLFSELTDKPTLREMCSNPLILAMYVARDQQGQRTGTADNRTGFYSQVTEELLVARRSRQLGSAAKTALLQQRESIMGHLALENLLDLEQPTNQISFRRALEVTRRVIHSTTVEQAEDYLRNMCKDTGLMTEERDGETLTFIHLTFCEFLAAKEAVEGRTDGLDCLFRAQKTFTDTAAPQHAATRLTEAIPFALGLLPRVRRAEVLEKVSQVADTLMLGRCFLESQEYGHPIWKGYVDLESTELMQTRPHHWDDAWLRRLHLFSVVLADEAEWAELHFRSPSFPLDRLFKKLIKKDRARLATIFGSYASFDAQAAFRLAYACGVDLVREQPEILVRHMPDPPFLSILIDQCKKDADGAADPWIFLFAEGALSSAYVSTRLSQEPWNIVPDTATPPAELPRRRRWFTTVSDEFSNVDGGMLRGSLLTYSLTVALRGVDPYAYITFPRLSAMRQASPPGRHLFALALRYDRWVRVTAPAVVPGAPLTVAALYADNVLLLLGSIVLTAVAAVTVDKWPGLSARYYTGVLLQSERLITGSRLNPALVPARIWAYLSVGRRILAADRIEVLRNLRVADGHGWQGLDSDESAAELLAGSKGVKGRTHRL